MCSKTLGWFVIRGERPIKLGNSWFSAKSIEVEHLKIFFWGRALIKLGGLKPYWTFRNSEYKNKYLNRQTLGAKVHCREGNSPDWTLRSLNNFLSDEGSEKIKTTNR